MSPHFTNWRIRAALLAGVASMAMSVAAEAKDLSATPDGAKKIVGFFETFAGKAASAPPALVVTPEGSDYLIAIDIAAMTTTLKSAGVSYESAIVKMKAFEQDDGGWRVEQSDFPPIKGTHKQGDATIDTSVSVSGLKNSFVIDPKLNWIRSADGGADKASIAMHGPGIQETIEAGAMKATMTGKAGGDGALTSTARESLGAFNLNLAVDPKLADPNSAKSDAKPVNVVANAAGAAVDAKLDASKWQSLVDLWKFWAAHPSRAELAANEPTLKALLSAAIVGSTAFDESIALQKLSVQTPQGAVAFDAAKVGVGGAFAGPSSRFEEHFSANGLSLPPGLVPDQYKDLAPTSIEIGFKASGFDAAAAAAEAIADMHLAGDAPPLSKEDHDKVMAKFVGSGPIVVDIAPSRVVAPLLDIAFDGQVRYEHSKPTGTVNLHVKNFDKTMTALKALGPAAEKQMVPVMAMAKGLGKSEADGTMTWVGEIGADGVMKVNGLPLGKAPF